jgi:hypothetical protein
MGCAPSSPVSRADGTWSGQDKTDPYNFSNALNWLPRGIPTGTATIPSLEQSGIFVTQPGTTVGAVQQTGNLNLIVLPHNSLSALSGGFTLCCGQAALSLEGEVIGDVTIGSKAGPTSNQVSGIGAIKGNVLHFSGTLGASKGAQNEGVLKIVGNYRLLTQYAAMTSDVWKDVSTAVEVSGTAYVEGATLLIAIDDEVKGPISSYKVLTASRIDGKFKNILVYPSGTAEPTYSATDLTITIHR